jgi:hypothetical protein
MLPFENLARAGVNARRSVDAAAGWAAPGRRGHYSAAGGRIGLNRAP